MDDASAPAAKQNLPVAKPPRLAFPALIVGNALLSISPLFVRASDVGPVASAFWRLAIALPVLGLLAWYSLRRAGKTRARATVPVAPGPAPGPPPAPRQPPAAVAICLAGGLFFAADIAAWHIGILATKIANATLFGNLGSLVLVVVALVTARRWPYRAEAAALLLAGTGAALLVRAGSQAGQARLIGDLFCIAAGLLYAGYMLAMQRARTAMASLPALALASAAGAPALLIAAVLLGETIAPHDWRPLIALALSSQVIGQGLLIFALRFFNPLIIGLSLLLQPASAALVGWLVYRETLTAPEIVGGLLVAAALVLARVPARPTGAPAAEGL